MDENVSFVFLMVRSVDPDLETDLRSYLHGRYGENAQLQMLGNENEAVEELWHVRQRILARRQQEYRAEKSQR